MEPYLFPLGVVVAAVLICGTASAAWWARGRVADSREALLEDQRDDFAEQVAELLKQGPAGAEAARIVVESARRTAAARRAADPRERHRLLLGGSESDGDPGASPPSGEA